VDTTGGVGFWERLGYREVVIGCMSMTNVCSEVQNPSLELAIQPFRHAYVAASTAAKASGNLVQEVQVKHD
jgi:hypothetical protein